MTSTTGTATMSTKAWTAFAAVSVLWGVPYLLIKVAVDDGAPPIFLAWVRIVIGAAVLLALAWRAGTFKSLAGRWRWLAIFALVEVTLPFPLIAAGEQHVSSSLAAILIAATPLFVAILALRFDATERANGARLAGLVIGLLGVVALVGIDVAGRTDELFGATAIMVAALCYAIGPMILKRKLADLDPVAAMGGTLALAAAYLTLPALLDPPSRIPSAEGVGALLALGFLCTALGLYFFFTLIAEVGAGRALVVTYINPVIAVALGMVLLGERPGAGAVLGLVLILAGSWLSTLPEKARRAETPAALGEESIERAAPATASS
jgi:drug/metabolite transporter (DMT)-like permease